MAMHLEKAQEIIRIYHKNAYKAGKTLRDLGYSESTSKKKPGHVIDCALRVLSMDDSSILSREEVAEQYRNLIMQNKDMSTKLKALMPLLANEGIRWGDGEKTVIRPVLSLVVKKN